MFENIKKLICSFSKRFCANVVRR